MTWYVLHYSDILTWPVDQFLSITYVVGRLQIVNAHGACGKKDTGFYQDGNSWSVAHAH